MTVNPWRSCDNAIKIPTREPRSRLDPMPVEIVCGIHFGQLCEEVEREDCQFCPKKGQKGLGAFL